MKGDTRCMIRALSQATPSDVLGFLLLIAGMGVFVLAVKGFGG